MVHYGLREQMAVCLQEAALTFVKKITEAAASHRNNPAVPDSGMIVA